MAGIESSPFQPTTNVNVGLDLRARFNVVRRRIFFFIAVLISAILIGGAVSIRSARIYKAATTVLIDVNAPEVLSGVREVYDLGVGYWTSKEYYQTQFNVIRSRVVAQKVVTTLGLSPAALVADLSAAAPMSTEARVAGDPLYDLPPSVQSKLRVLGMEEYPTRAAMIEKLKTFDAVGFIQKRVQVDPVKDSRLVQIAIEDTDPNQAAAIANAVADAYIEVNLDQKVDATRSAVNWLTEQLRDLKIKVDQSETALHNFRKENNMVSVTMEDRQTMISQTLTQLNQSLSAARAEGFASEARRDQIVRSSRNGALADTVEAVIANPLVQKLKATHSDLRQEEAQLAIMYTPEHPKVASVREKLALVNNDLHSEVNKIIQTVSAQYALSVETQRHLEQEIQRLKVEALELGRKEVEYSRLKRERDNSLSLYEVILKREKEANLTQMLKVNNVRKLDAARAPEKPIRPNIKMNMLSALLIGLLAGVALTFVVDYLDNSVKSQDQVEQVIGLPFLGIVPTLKAMKSGRELEVAERDMYIVKHPRSIAAECWRTIRTNVMFMTPDSPARSILVSSSGPREGKSTTVINLSVTMALLGTRTLVVDTDMRRPRLHKSFGMSNDIGLTSLILGDVHPDQALRPTEVERLDLLTCGPIPPNPAELLHTERFRAVFEMLKQRYQHIIFDSPPVGAVTDAMVLASMTDGVVMVVHCGKTSWQSTVQTRRRFEDVGSRIYGIVLNNVDLDKRSSGEYYYYNHYRYGDEVDEG